MEKLLVATYDQDLLQFEMFCYCINKNWQGNRFLTVILNSSVEWNDTYLRLKTIIEKYLLGWDVEIIDGRHQDRNGYREQATNKVIYSIDDRFDDTIVFDSKDFLLRKSDISDFKNSRGYRVTYWYPETRHIDMYPRSIELLDIDMSHIPGTLDLTPWIWRIDQLEKFWKYVLARFGPISQWKNVFEGGTESDAFFAFTYCDPESTMDFWQPDENPLIVGGGWTHQTYEGIVQEAQDFDRWIERKIWKHSRKLEDPRCLDITRSVLLKHGIEQEIVDRVFGS